MAELKPIYLVSGDDDAKIDSWRARLRERAESEGGPGALEVHDASSSAPGDMAGSLSMLTMAAGTRFLLADGAQAWKAKDIEPLELAMAAMPPETVLVLIVRGKPLERLVKAVEKAGERFARTRPPSRGRCQSGCWSAPRATG